MCALRPRPRKGGSRVLRQLDWRRAKAWLASTCRLTGVDLSVLCRSWRSSAEKLVKFCREVGELLQRSFCEIPCYCISVACRKAKKGHVPFAIGTRPYRDNDTSLSGERRVPFVKSSCGFCQILLWILVNPPVRYYFSLFTFRFYLYVVSLRSERQRIPSAEGAFISYSLFITAKRDTHCVSRFAMLNKTLFSSTILLLGNIQTSFNIALA